MTTQNELRDRIAEVVHDENERLRSDNGLRYDPLKYDELPDKHRENRESIAQAIIDEFGLTMETGDGQASPYGDGPITLDGMRRIVGKWEKQ